MAEKVERLVYGVAEAAALLGLSKSGVYEAVAQGTLPHIRIGRSVRVPKAAIERILEEAMRKSTTAR